MSEKFVRVFALFGWECQTLHPFRAREKIPSLPPSIGAAVSIAMIAEIFRHLSATIRKMDIY
jgi:hypothetical protein